MWQRAVRGAGRGYKGRAEAPCWREAPQQSVSTATSLQFYSRVYHSITLITLSNNNRLAAMKFSLIAIFAIGALAAPLNERQEEAPTGTPLHLIPPSSTLF